MFRFNRTREIASTVVTMSVSLVSAFIPLLLMGGLVGRMFREFAVTLTLTLTVAISMVVSLTTTPMLCAALLKPQSAYRHGRLYHASERIFDFLLRGYLAGLRWVLRHPVLMLAVMAMTVGATVMLAMNNSKTLLPQQDTGRLIGSIIADQNTSSQSMSSLIARFMRTVSEDPRWRPPSRSQAGRVAVRPTTGASSSP